MIWERTGVQDEGTQVQFKVIASQAPTVDVPLIIDISQTGDFIMTPEAGSDALNEGINHVVFTANQGTSEEFGPFGKVEQTFMVQTKAAGTASGDGRITATLQEGYTNVPDTNANSASVAIWDTDRPRVAIESTTPLGVDEGDSAEFKISVVPHPSAATFEVIVNVSQIGYSGVDFIDGVVGIHRVSLTPKMATDENGDSYVSEYSGELSVVTDDDEVEEENGTIVARIVPSSTYNINPLPHLATALATVRDNDHPPIAVDDLPYISIAPVSVAPVVEGGLAWFEMRALTHRSVPKAFDSAVNIQVGLTNSGGNFIDTTDSDIDVTTTGIDVNGMEVNLPVSQVTTQVELPANHTSVRFSVPTLQDDIDESDGGIFGQNHSR